MTSKVTINRLATGVPGLDGVLGGGLPEFSFNLIAGPPGCGKTTLAHQMMFSLATPERPALYFTVLGEPPLKMLRYQQQFEFFDPEAINRSIRFINLADEALAGNLDEVLRLIIVQVEQYTPALVFVDSFRSVVLAAGAGSGAGVVEDDSRAHARLQRFIQELAVLMTGWQATTFLIGEYFTETDANPVFTVADGIVWLRQSVQRNSMVRKLEIMKMRGQATQPGLHSFRIDNAGLQVFASSPRRLAAPAPDVGNDRLALGIPLLDGMLCGGVPRGYSLLVAGPSGSGKSILAASFLAEGVRQGEPGVIAVFERQIDRARSPVLSRLLEADQIGIVEGRTADLSIEELLLQLLAETKRRHARRVVIDSLSSLELALAPTFREDFRESLLRLVNALTAEGLTVLLTSELEDRYNDLRFSPNGTAFLSDAIVVQRYIEIESCLRRVMAVIKVRASAHSNELREYVIGDDGIRMGELLTEQEGLLSGRPHRRVS